MRAILQILIISLTTYYEDLAKSYTFMQGDILFLKLRQQVVVEVLLLDIM